MDLRCLDSLLFHSPKMGTGREVGLAQGASSAAVIWWETFTRRAGGLAAIKSCLSDVKDRDSSVNQGKSVVHVLEAGEWLVPDRESCALA